MECIFGGMFYPIRSTTIFSGSPSFPGPIHREDRRVADSQRV